MFIARVRSWKSVSQGKKIINPLYLEVDVTLLCFFLSNLLHVPFVCLALMWSSCKSESKCVLKFLSWALKFNMPISKVSIIQRRETNVHQHTFASPLEIFATKWNSLQRKETNALTGVKDNRKTQADTKMKTKKEKTNHARTKILWQAFIDTPWHLSQRNGNLCAHKNPYTNVHGCFICNSQKLESGWGVLQQVNS